MELVAVGPDLYACLQPDLGLGYSNAGLVASGDGLVVDTFWDLPRTRTAIGLFADVLPDGGVAGRLVNTHHNGDHCYGNQLYAEAGAEIIGHRLCAQYMGEDAGPAFLAGLAAADRSTLPPALHAMADGLTRFDFVGVEVTPPTTVVDDDGAVYDVGGTEVHVRYLGPAHTAGDVVVHVPDAGVVFTGDLLFHECTPIGWEGTNDRWVRALEEIAALGCETVVPGHGPLATNDGVLAMRDYLVYVFDEARTHFDAGRTPLDAASRIELGPYAGWTEPERLAMNVHRAYREFAGGAWDDGVDVMAAFADVGALAAQYRER